MPSVAELVVTITAETAAAESGIRNVGTVLTSLANLAGLAGTSVADMGTKVEAASAKATLLETRSAAAAMQSQNLGIKAEQAAVQAEMFAAKADLGGIGAEAFGVKSQLAAGRAQDFGVRAFTAAGQAEYLGTRATAAATEAEKLATASEGVGTKLSLVGPLALAAGAGIAIVADGLLKATSAAGEWETTLTQIANNTNLSTAAIQQMGAGIQDIATNTGGNMDQVAHAFEHAQNVTQDFNSALAITKVATESAISTGANATDVTNLLANAMHEYGLDTEAGATATGHYASVQAAANDVMGAMHLATAESNTQLGQFSEATAKAVGIAANLGVSMNDVFAATSALTRHGFPDVYQAGVQVTDMLTHMMNPSAASKKALEDLAVASGNQGVAKAFEAGTIASNGFVGTIQLLKKAMDDAGMSTSEQEGEMNKIIPALRGGLGAAALTGTAFSDLNKTVADLNDTTKTSTVTMDSFSRTLDTTGGQANITKARLGELAQTIGGPLNQGLGGILSTFNDISGGIGTMVGTIHAGLVNATKDSGDFFGEFAQGAKAYVDAANGDSDATATLTAYDQQLSHMQSDMSGSIDATTSSLLAQQAAMENRGGAGYYGPSDAYQAPDVAYIEQQAKAAAAAQVQADKDAKAQLKTNFDQALADAKTYYADQKATALDAATATKDIATTAAQQELDAAKTGIDGEKKLYDDRAQADIKARQDQTTSALQELQKQETAANVAAAAANTRAGADAQAANTRATTEAAAANTLANVQGAAAQHAADESDTAWKNQVTAIKDSATAGENALHTSNDAILKNAVDTANDAYNAQITAIDGEIHAREEGDARAIHSRELATASAIANIESEKTAALRAVDEETQAYQAEEAAKLKAISATASAQVKALNDSLADEKRANTERLAVNTITKASGAGAGAELGSFFTATDAQIADAEAAIAAKAAGNQKLADQDTAAAAKQAALAQTASDQLSAINQTTADQMVAYKLQTDTTLTADNVAAINQQANDQKSGLAAQLADFKQTEADKKQSINDTAANAKSHLTQDLADYKWTMAQNLQAFKDVEAEKKREDKATLDQLLTSYATQQAAENARHQNAIDKINDQAKIDIAAIDLLAQKRKDDYAAQVADRAAAFAKANTDRAADYAAATAQRTADYTAATALRAAAYKDATEKINAQAAIDVAAMQKAQKAADDAFAARTKAADDHHKQEQIDIAATYKADTDAINDAATKHNAALLDRSKHMTEYTTATDLSWQTLIGDAQAYAAAIGAAGTPGSFHAPGKGPQSGPRLTAADFPTSGSAHDIFMSTYSAAGQDPAAIWAQQANQHGGGGGGGLVPFLQNQVASGAANGWQSFGQASAQNSREIGQDIGMTLGTPIPAAQGVVIDVKPWGYGDWAVTERLPDGHEITIGHLYPPPVTVGQSLSAGETLGMSRGIASPISSGPHIEVQYDQGGQDPVSALGLGRTSAYAGGIMGGGGGGGSTPPLVININNPVLLSRSPELAADLWRLIEPAMRQQSSYTSR